MAIMARYTPTMGGILSDVGNAFKNALNTVNPMNAKNVVTSGFNSVVDAVKNPFSPTKQFNLLKNSAGVEIFKQNYNDITRNIPGSIALPSGFLKKNTTVSAGGGTSTAIPQNVVDNAAAAYKSGGSWGDIKQGTLNKSRAVVKTRNTTPGRSAGSSKMNFEENPVDNAAKIEQANPQGTQQARQEGAAAQNTAAQQEAQTSTGSGAAAQNTAAQQEAQTSTGSGAGGSTFYINLPETQKTEEGGDYKKWLLIGGLALAALYLLKGDK